jgi:Family of unknown function (DUF5677)
VEKKKGCVAGMGEDIAGSRNILREHFPEQAKGIGSALGEKNAIHKRLQPWHEAQLIHFIGILIISASGLERALEEKMITTLAWVVRNLLELSIWIEFCAWSDENAKRFYDDGIRDLYGWSKAIMDMHKEKNAEEHKRLSEKMEELEKLAESRGLGKLGDDYMQVRKAAEELGRENDFAGLYKLCSKFAHPTAWVVRSAASTEADAEMREMFFMDGVDLAIASLSRIRNRIEFSFPELRPQEGNKGCRT